MSTTIEVAPDRLIEARAHVAALALDLRSGLDSIHADVGALLAGGWTGRSADGFNQAWQQWRTGSTHVLDALDETGHLLWSGGQEYRAQEERTRAEFSAASPS